MLVCTERHVSCHPAGSNKKTKSTNREYLYLASSDLEQALKHAKKKNVDKITGKKSKKMAAKKEDKIPVDTVQDAPEQDEQVTNAVAEAPKSQKKKKKKKGVKSTGSERASNSHENGIDATPGNIEDEPSQKTRRKSVRFSLKKNLVRRIGEPPFPENVRTPPTSKPKGSALKQKPLVSQNRKRMLSFSNAADEPNSLETKSNKKKKDIKKKKKKMTES